MDQKQDQCQGHSPHDHYNHTHFDLLPEPTHRHRDLEQITQFLLMAIFLVAALVIGLHMYFHH